MRRYEIKRVNQHFKERVAAAKRLNKLSPRTLAEGSSAKAAEQCSAFSSLLLAFARRSPAVFSLLALTLNRRCEREQRPLADFAELRGGRRASFCEPTYEVKGLFSDEILHSLRSFSMTAFVGQPLPLGTAVDYLRFPPSRLGHLRASSHGSRLGVGSSSACGLCRNDICALARSVQRTCRVNGRKAPGGALWRGVVRYGTALRLRIGYLPLPSRPSRIQRGLVFPGSFHRVYSKSSRRVS